MVLSPPVLRGQHKLYDDEIPHSFPTCQPLGWRVAVLESDPQLKMTYSEKETPNEVHQHWQAVDFFWPCSFMIRTNGLLLVCPSSLRHGKHFKIPPRSTKAVGITSALHISTTSSFPFTISDEHLVISGPAWYHSASSARPPHSHLGPCPPDAHVTSTACHPSTCAILRPCQKNGPARHHIQQIGRIGSPSPRQGGLSPA